MAEPELNIKEIIDKTNNFDQPFAPQIPEGICEVEVKSFENKLSSNGFKMLVITVADKEDRVARVNQMLELQWIAGTIRLIKGLYTHNASEDEKEAAKEKINKYFNSAKNEDDLQTKCTDILQKLIDKGCAGWLRVERQNPEDKYADKALTAYKPSYRWKTTIDDITTGGESVELDDDPFKD